MARVLDLGGTVRIFETDQQAREVAQRCAKLRHLTGHAPAWSFTRNTGRKVTVRYWPGHAQYEEVSQ